MNANAYQLFISLRSPFARRIRLAMHRLKLDYSEKVVDVFQENPELFKANPLGMVPTLVTPDAGTLCDSLNILDYLDEKTHRIWSSDFATRIQQKQAAAIAAGLMQSTVLYFQEAKMHEVPSAIWMKDHLETLERTLKHLSQLPSSVWTSGGELTQAAWDLSAGLEYLSLRFPEIEWKNTYPVFTPVLSLARKNAYFLETEPKL